MVASTKKAASDGKSSGKKSSGTTKKASTKKESTKKAGSTKKSSGYGEKKQAPAKKGMNCKFVVVAIICS